MRAVLTAPRQMSRVEACEALGASRASAYRHEAGLGARPAQPAPGADEPVHPPELVDLEATSCPVRLARVSVESDLEQGAREWAGQMLTAAANLKRAEDGKPGAPSLAEARVRVDQLYKNSEKIYLLIERSAGDPLGAQATFRLALTKHEQAERLTRQARDPQDLQTAWQNAETWWNIFLTKYDSRPWLARGQLEHARTLQALARRRAAAVEEKKP